MSRNNTQLSTNPKDIIGRTKPPMELIPPAAKIALAVALRNGAEKYGPYNWRGESIEAGVYIGAIQRHLDAWWDGEENAKDSKVPHLAHAIAGLAILIDAISLGKCVDNRPLPGKAPELVAAATLQRKEEVTA